MKTAFQYIRISDEDQSNFSISGQQLVNEQFAKRNNIRIVKTFIDDGYSAKNFNRPQWQQMEKELTKNKVDYLIVWKYDRFIRNTLEGLIFIERLEDKLNIRLLSVLENYGIDPADPYFKKQRAEMLVDAEFERNKISDRTKMGQWSGRCQGRFFGIAPYGYTNSRDSKDQAIIVVDAQKAKIVQGMFEDFLNDHSFATIAQRAKEKGFDMTAKEVIKRILTNRTYAGLIKVGAYRNEPEKTVKGLHDALISEDVYWKTYYKIQEQTKIISPKVHDENLPLRGFLLCENCSSPHTGAKCKGKNKYYYYYWCNNCRGKNFPAQKTHSDLETILKGLSLKKHLIDAYRVQTKLELEKVQKDRSERLTELNREFAITKKKLDSLEEKYIDDKIEQETYQKWYSTYSEDLNKKSSLIADLQKDSLKVSQQFLPFMDYLGDLNFVYNQAEITEKQPFLRAIFPGCLITKSEGYRTPYIIDHLFVNSLPLKGLLDVKKEGELSFSENSPLGVGNGGQIEHLLSVISRIIKAA